MSSTPGAKVAIWDLDGPGKVDVADNASILSALRSTLDRLGKIDILVNNAGIAGPTAPVVDYPIDQWERVIRIDLNGPFLCCRAVVPHMVKAGYGRIVNIASVAGKEGNPNAAAYAAAKGGLIAFTKALGKELAQSGVLVNCVTPAAVRIPMHFATDAECLRAALRLAGADPAGAKIVRILNTLALDRFTATTTYQAEVQERNDLSVLEAPKDWEFTAEGNLA